jgi:hypothetical protein
VDRSEAGLVRVEGLVDSVEHKQELLARLADIAASPFVAIDIKTVDEALQGSSSAGVADQRSRAASGAEATRPAGETLEVVATDSPIRKALERYLRQQLDSNLTQDGSRRETDLQEMASEFSSRVVSSSLANLNEAWALRRLAERYGGSARARLPAAVDALLREMLAAHVTALRTRTAGIQGQVRRLLLTLVPRGAPATASSEPGRVATDTAGEQDWAAQCLRIFQEVESSEALTTGLFADSGDANGVRREASSERAAAALLIALPRLEGRLHSLEERLTALEGKPPENGLPTAGLPASDLP